MLRIHFSTEDLARVRLASGPHLLWETLLSLHVLQEPAGSLVFDLWRGRVQRGLGEDIAPLLRIAPPQGYSPDFLTPATPASSIGEGVETLLSTPRAQLQHDLARLATERGETPWLRSLAQGGMESMVRLGQAMQAYYRLALAPQWSDIERHISLDRSARAQLMLENGTEAVLSNLHPEATWESPVLTLPYPVEQDLHLAGRGLTLLPSFFCRRQPVTVLNTELAPVLVYPLGHSPSWSDGAGVTNGGSSLAALLGRTRASILNSLTSSRRTGEIAELLNIAPSSVSEHTTVLREAGLITSQRHRNTVYHLLTPLGTDLLKTSY